MKFFVFFILLFFLSINCFAFRIYTDAFKEKDFIPKEYTCDSIDYSPAIFWEDPPQNTESFAIVCEDPDAPVGLWVHWIALNIPKDYRKLEKNLPKVFKLEDGIIQGVNDFGKIGYNGPCPPKGSPHRYYFKIYALDDYIKIEDNYYIDYKKFKSLIKDHIIESAEFFGYYKH